MFVERITNPQALQVPLIAEFFVKAAEACKIPKATEVPAYVARLVEQPFVGCFLAIDDNEPQAVILVMLPDSPFMFVPFILMIYSQEPGAAKPVIEAAIDFGRKSGYTKAWGLNTTGMPVKVAKRAFSYIGQIEEAGEILEYKF